MNYSLFFTVFFAVITALALWNLGKYWIAKLNAPPCPQPAQKPFVFASPADALRADLGRYFYDVNDRLNAKWKSSAFPIRFDIGKHSAWASQKTVISLISALLEQRGWVVSRNEKCSETEIIIDLPRKVFDEVPV